MVSVEEALGSRVGEPARSVLTGAELAVRTLEANGVTTVFGIPGVHTLALYDALLDSSLRHVLARHEQGVGFMADGYARASGKPGVALVITGPGITNVATPIGQAYTDSSPVFVLSSNNRRAYADQMRGSLHDLKNQLGVMAAVTQWNTRVTQASETGMAVAEGLRRLQTGRPLPVHVEIPLDVLDESARIGDIVVVSPPDPLIPARDEIATAVEQIAASQRIVLYCGGGAVNAAAGDAVLRLADRLGALVVTSTMGKGSVPEDHPRVVGPIWHPGNQVDELVRSADCLVVFGSKLGYQATEGFTFPFPERLIRIDVDPVEMARNAQPSSTILADARLAAEALDAALDARGVTKYGYNLDEIAAAISAARATAFGGNRKSYLDALRRAVPRDGIIAWDMTMMSYAAIELFPVYEPRTFLYPSGYGTLGFSFPAALGAKIAKPDRAVACVIGDGGFQYTMAELGTAIQHRIGVPIVIFNDSTYSAVKDEQARSRGGRYVGVDLINPDFLAIARAYGIEGIRADSPEALEAAVKAALERELPTIIDVPLEPWVD